MKSRPFFKTLYNFKNCKKIFKKFIGILRACEKAWSAKETASVVLSAERQRRTENVFHMLLKNQKLHLK